MYLQHTECSFVPVYSVLCAVYFVPVQVFIFYILSCWLCVVMCWVFFACVLVFLFACLFCFALFVCFVCLFVLLDFFSLFLLAFALLIISPTPLLYSVYYVMDHVYVLLCNLVYFFIKYKM